MLVEFATKADLPELGEAVVAASRELHDRYGTPDMSRAILAGMAYGIDREQAVVVARDEVGICGFVIWIWFDGVSAVGAVDGLGTWVAAKHRRTGLGAAMRELAERRCVEAGRSAVSGIVALGNDAALESVQKMGFEVVGLAVTKRFGC